MRNTYSYVGPPAIARCSTGSPLGRSVESAADVLRWVRETQQVLDQEQTVVATFVVDEVGRLRMADRRSEHVACAGRKPVQTAGEIAFRIDGPRVAVAWVTNQSTGYCPEPDSWPAVQAALERAGFNAPHSFSQEFNFRRCVNCGAINLVKDGVFECAVCAAPLPAEWNCLPGDADQSSTRPPGR
jgi:hypothetical protein